jgi:hypothetical protein
MVSIALHAFTSVRFSSRSQNTKELGHVPLVTIACLAHRFLYLLAPNTAIYGIPHLPVGSAPYDINPPPHTHQHARKSTRPRKDKQKKEQLSRAIVSAQG